MLRQQTDNLPYVEHMIYDDGNPVITPYPGVYNYGTIYAATHGRGFFKSELYTSINNQGEYAEIKEASLKVFPNPVEDVMNIEFDLPKAEEVVVNVYSINGQLVKQFNLDKRVKGLSKAQFNLGELNDGVYFVQMVTPTQKATSKIIVR